MPTSSGLSTSLPSPENHTHTTDSRAREEGAIAVAEPSSFRDPCGFVYRRGRTVFRQVNPAGSAAYAQLRGSGLYDALISAGLLIPHEEADLAERMTDSACYVLRPERIPFLSYPYEWSFGQLQDAALTTLAIQRAALQRGMSLKDGSAYNIQFHRSARPVFIDTLSFEPYHEGAPWVAYRQFCQHFLAPLALMALVDVRLQQLLLRGGGIDGVPLDLASRLLPLRSRLDPSLLPHLFLHQAAQQRHADDGAAAASSPPGQAARGGTLPKSALLGLLDNLEGGIRRLSWQPKGTTWGDYYDGGTKYDEAAFAAKQKIVGRLLAGVRPAPAHAFDLGANTGVFSRLAAAQGIPVVALDSDPAAVEKCYRTCRADDIAGMLPLLQDLTDPSADRGWAHAERRSLLGRCQEAARDGGTVALALALVHHLAIGNNVPLPHVASLFASVAEHLIVEWIPKEDAQVRRLLATRKDIFPDYTETAFERAFEGSFAILRREPIPGTDRILYWMRRRLPPASL